MFFLTVRQVKANTDMGKYIDKGNMGFREARNGEYVDKSGLIAVINGMLGTEFKFCCVSRARRFGKSMAAKMLMAYYDRSCDSRDSRELFQDLEIAGAPTFEEHLNKHPVIYLDFSAFATSFHKKGIVSLIDTELKKDIREAYPDVPLPRGADLMAYLKRVNAKKGDRFFFIIDEWDALLREVPGAVTDDYVNWLRHMFKDVSASDVFLGVYMTGILPIKKYDTQSALNNFTEYSMVKPGAFAVRRLPDRPAALDVQSQQRDASPKGAVVRELLGQDGSLRHGGLVYQDEL